MTGIVVADRVFETSTTQGVGTLNLAGAPTSFQTFVAGVGDGAQVPYIIDDGTDWEVGLGTVTSGSPDTLSRDTIFASSNSDAAVNWGVGTRNVRITNAANVVPTLRSDNVWTQQNQFNGKVLFNDAGELTIASGVVTVSGAKHTVDTESDAASDDLDTISGGVAGAICIVRANNTARTVVIKHGTGNIQTADGNDISLDTTEKFVVLFYDGTLAKWLVIAGNFNTKADTLNSFFSGQVIYGLTMSNNATDATNDIDISIGGAISSNGVQMALSSGLTKKLDAAWTAGTNQGGLDTGTIANATYHLWLIRKDSDGSLDVLFSLSSTTPTMPSGYSEKCLIGRIIRTSGAIALFKQIGRHIKLKEGINLFSKLSTTLTNGETFNSLVSGVIGKCSITMNTSSTSGVNYYSLADNIQPGATNAQYITGARNISGSNSIDAASFEIPMISGTMVFYCGSTAASTLDIYLNGWEEI